MAWVYHWNCLDALFWSLLVQILMLGGFIFSGLAIDLLRHASQPDAGVLRWPFDLHPPSDWSLVQRVVLASSLVLAFTLLRSFVHYESRMADERLVQRIVVGLRVRLYEKLQRMSFSYFDHQDSGTIINRVTGDAASVRLFIQNVLLRMIITMITLALFLGYMFREHVMLTLAVSSVIPFQIYFVRRFSVHIRPQFMAMRQSMDRLIQSLQETILGVRVIRGFGQEGQMVEKLDERNADAQGRRLGIVNTASVYMPTVPAVNFVQLAILLGYGGYLVHVGAVAGGIGLGTFWVFLGLIRQLSMQVDRLVQSASTIPEAMTGAQRVFELLDADIEIKGGSETGDDSQEKMVKGRIEFERVSFRYGNGEGKSNPVVLEDVSLVIEPGETIALVGPAGSGKSTLIDLIPRFYDAISGRVLVDGVDVREWDLKALRRNIGYTMQEPFLFSNTIMNNIVFGDPDTVDEIVHGVAEDAAALSFIEATEYGFDTIVGERGLTLSGGERQRLSLARTLLIRAPILLLDDATSSVDARTEKEIQDALAKYSEGRTTIIVAHRLSTLRKADRIVVIENGRVTAVGTHDELIKKNEHYRKTAAIQLEDELEDKSEEVVFASEVKGSGDSDISGMEQTGSGEVNP